jgi:hypothetical protein
LADIGRAAAAGGEVLAETVATPVETTHSAQLASADENS